MSTSHLKLAQDILEAVGGKENIQKVTHCATRLRLFLRDESKASSHKVENIEGVVSVVQSAGQFQIVIGQHVRHVFDEFVELMDLNVNDGFEEEKEDGSILNKVISTMSAVFAPFVYILAAAGIIQGSLILTNLVFPQFADTGTYEILSMISWAPFVFLPIFIAITAARHFNVNPYIAVAANAALVSPDLANIVARISQGEAFNLVGFQLSPTLYTSTVLPALFLVWGLSYLEKFLDRILPEVYRPLFTPLFSLVIAVPLTLLVIGPITAGGANLVAQGYNWLVAQATPLAALVIGGFWQSFVLFGVHWGITPVILSNHAQFGHDTFQAYQTIAVISQVGAALGVALKTNDKRIKRVGVSGFVTGLFGITEPAIYGVTLRFKRPFIFAGISGAIGAFVASFFNVHYYAYAGLPGPLTIVNAYNPSNPTSIWGELIGAGIAMFLPVILIHIFGYGDDSVHQTEKEKTRDIPSRDTVNDEKIQSPLKGEVIPLDQVPDEVFAGGLMGPGVAIQPSNSTVVSPVNGEVTFVADSLHAIGLTSDEGAEILIHVGLETVELKGEPFTTYVSNGDRVEVGQKLLEFNSSDIQSAELSLITPVIITNADDYDEIDIATSDQEDYLIHLIKKQSL